MRRPEHGDDRAFPPPPARLRRPRSRALLRLLPGTRARTERARMSFRLPKQARGTRAEEHDLQDVEREQRDTANAKPRGDVLGGVGIRARRGDVRPRDGGDAAAKREKRNKNLRALDAPRERVPA